MNQMTTLRHRLMSLDKDIKVGIIGIGSIGKGLVFQCNLTPGIKPVAIADINLKKAIDCAKWLNFDYDIVNNVDDLNYAIQRGRVAVTDNGEIISSSGLINVMIEASNAVYQGAVHAMKAINNHQHVVMMNYEAEMMYGPLLLEMANDAGVVYTCADGDQPTVIKKLIDDITLWGFDVVMAGNIKGFHDLYTNPTKIAPEADKRSLDHKMCSSYTDGSKLCVEMAVLANAINGRTAIPGMYGHKAAKVHDIFKLYDFEKLWDGKTPLVDYLLGAEPKGGVFVIGHTKDKFMQYTLDWFPPDTGPGPFYLFYRPYHLGALEAMECVAQAYLDHTARLQPIYGMKTNVFTYAKKDLKAGETLDGMGGYNSYGLIENLGDQKEAGLPILLNDGLKLKRDIAQNERISLDDVEYNPEDPAFKLYFDAINVKSRPSDRIKVSDDLVSTIDKNLQYAQH
ncbi:homoserine dehydrogenase [Chryseosolibacter indicus]|uniref:Homoserine dehydrogenase n=1 Tax=Chryseosolibacter indicus TaxID=2782351 RepID=A0ABS5VJW5_9BACT|nr:homoserine dehydrogenase [Chryseosolibacter indicus]MBT1701733.1 homoserine dehydrogenase [Chryseosolibacter indicus]